MMMHRAVGGNSVVMKIEILLDRPSNLRPVWKTLIELKRNAFQYDETHAIGSDTHAYINRHNEPS